MILPPLVFPGTGYLHSFDTYAPICLMYGRIGVSYGLTVSCQAIHDKRSAAEEIAQVNAAYPSFECLYQGILKGEITLYH